MMTNDQLEVKAAFDAIAGRLDQGIVEFDNRTEIDALCRSLNMDATDFADGLHDEKIFELMRGEAELMLVYTYMPEEECGGDYGHRYDLTEKFAGEVVRERRWIQPSDYKLELTELSATKL